MAFKFCTVHHLLASLPEKEVPVKVGYVDCVHIDDIDVSKSRQGQVLQKLATEASGTDAEYSAVVVQEVSHSWVRLKVWPSNVAWPVQQEIQVLPTTLYVHDAAWIIANLE